MENRIRITDSSACYTYTKDEMAAVSLTAALINACLRHIHDKGCNEISYEDYTRIKSGAVFLVHSGQVNEAKDIELGAILECFNDTDVDRKYL